MRHLSEQQLRDLVRTVPEEVGPVMNGRKRDPLHVELLVEDSNVRANFELCVGRDLVDERLRMMLLYTDDVQIDKMEADTGSPVDAVCVRLPQNALVGLRIHGLVGRRRVLLQLSIERLRDPGRAPNGRVHRSRDEVEGAEQRDVCRCGRLCSRDHRNPHLYSLSRMLLRNTGRH